MGTNARAQGMLRAITLVLAAFLILSLTGDPAGICPNAAAAPSTLAEATGDGTEFWQGVYRAIKQWNDCVCDSQLETYKPQKTVISAGKIYYKKENRLRLEVKGGGYRDGSLIVRQADGKVRGQGGMLMAFVKMDLDPDSRMLKLPNGLNAARSDLPSLASELTGRLSRGYSCRVTPGPVASEGMDKRLYVLEVFSPDANGGGLSDRIYVEPAGRVPIRWDLYRGGKKFSSAYFNNVRLNSGLSDDLFVL